MDQKLQNYINQSRTSGQTDEQIKQQLLQSGWSQAQINEAFGVSGTQSAMPYQPRRRRGGLIFKIIIFLILLAFICVGGFFAYKYYYSLVKAPQNNQNPVVTEETYKNNEFGFQFSYPPNFQLKENFPETGVLQLILAPNDGSGFDNWEIEVAKQDSSYYLMGCEGYSLEQSLTSACFEKNGIMYLFSTDAEKNSDLAPFNKMVSGIKFLNP